VKWRSALAKYLVLKVCGSELQQKIRRLYLVHQVTKNRGSREPEMRVLKSLVFGGESVADIGANAGVYTIALASLVGSSGAVYSFEPIAANYDILQTVINKAHLSNVRPFRAALGIRLERHEMVIPDLEGFTGYYLARLADSSDTGRRELVDVLTLDELWQRKTIVRLDFVKCDVEGSELDVIRGGLLLIKDQRPGWLLEVSRQASDMVFSVLTQLGYRAFVYDKQLIHTDSYMDNEFSNYFFFHPDSKIWSRALPLLQDS
jgi:FkbM family methyltransferase